MNSDHLCKRVENCESLKLMTADKIYPDLCSYNGHESDPIICCPPATVQKIQVLNDLTDKRLRIVNESIGNFINFFFLLS